MAKNAQKLSSKYLVQGIGAKLVSNCEQNMSYNKSWQFFGRKKDVYINRLDNVIFGMWMCKFYRPEHNTKGGGTSWNWILMVFKYRNEIYQKVELKE